MRPLKISMTAFGPYKHQEVIDFTELKNNRLFVVSGNTGAGKTTIFDAICFALYGSASGEDRSDTKFMRSDFADDDVHTAVELEFELHNRYYRIKRQLPHVKQGNKSATGEQYEFFERVNGREIPCVDRQIVSEINKKVEELVGLTKEQFSQIVMLPQGEFRKLLTSQTENKEEILRKIFRTEPYRWINERLKEKKKQAENAFNREKETRDRHFDSIKATLPEREESQLFEVLGQEHFNSNQVITGLDDEMVYYQNEIQKNKQQEQQANTAYNLKLEEFHKAEVLNAEFKKLEDKQNSLQQLTEQIPVYAAKEKQHESAERASKIESYEIQVNEWRLDETQKKQKLVDAEGAYKLAVQQLEQAQKVYESEEGRKTERENVTRELDRFQDILPTVKEIDTNKIELAEKRKEVQQLEKETAILQQKLKEEKLAKTQISHDIKELEKAVDQLAAKQQKLSEMRERVRVLKDYLTLNQKQAIFEKTAKTQERSYLEIKKQFEQLEEAWIGGQASILALHLHDGKPCPVCGSNEHPNKAQDQDTVPTKDELDAVKKDLDVRDSAYRDTVAQMKTNKELLDKKAEELEELGISVQDVQRVYDQLVADGKALNVEVESLGKEKVKLDQLKQNLEIKEKQLAQLDEQEERQAKTYQQQYTAYETKRAVYEEQVNRIPEEVRSLVALEQKIANTKALKTKLEKAWEAAQNQLQLAKETITNATANINNAKTQVEESTTKKVKAETQFVEALQQADFATEEAYRAAKMPEKDRLQLKEEIATFKQNLATLKQQVTELQESLKDKNKADMTVLKAELDELKKAYEGAQELLRQSDQYLLRVIEIKEKIIETEKNVAEMERQLNIVADLYDVIRGQNSRKISFERYLQIEYLEQIIIAANERLKHLSNGQFVLMRSDRQESRGKQSGLGLDVFDAYTGQTRDVKTLSGGEKFNASLCLALGMADVIQSFQGGVSIDTMFIDEGFGSLDEESLNKAIDTLIDLQQSGRMIGVISHVQELKNAIPAILEVKKTKEGYSETQFVLR